jgi:hypothetical protein
MISEGYPVWLLALEPSWTNHVTLVGWTSLDSLITDLTACNFPTDLISRAYGRLSSNKVGFIDKISTSDTFHGIMLVSGSIPFLIEKIKSLPVSTVSVVGTVDTHVSSRFKR